MKRRILWLVLAAVLFALAGCGGGDDRPVFETTIASDPSVDGDILRDGTTGGLTITIPGGGPGATLLAGVDAATDDEYRAFLDFPLDSIPLNAVIQSATLNIVVRNLSTSPPDSSIPLLVELVFFDPPLTGSDFDSAVLLPLSSTQTLRTISPVHVNDFGGVDINVTSLMVEAQARGLSSFQVRLLEDFVTTPLGIVTIDDSDANPPQLRVLYF